MNTNKKMSAYIVDREHILFLTACAMARGGVLKASLMILGNGLPLGYPAMRTPWGSPLGK